MHSGAAQKKVVLSLDHENGKHILYVSNEGEEVKNAEIRVMKVNGAAAETISAFTMDIPAASASSQMTPYIRFLAPQRALLSL